VSDSLTLVSSLETLTHDDDTSAASVQPQHCRQDSDEPTADDVMTDDVQGTTLIDHY